VIGKLPKDQIPPVSDHLLLAGKRWQVMSVDHDRAEALVRPAAGRKPPGFTGGDREIAPEIRRKMQAILRQQSMPAYIDSLSAQLLTSARIEATTSGLTERDIVRTSEGHLLWFPWTGSRAIRTMVLLLEYANVACDIDKSELSIEFRKPPTEIRDSLANLLSRIPPAEILAEQAANLERRKWDSLISRELLIASYAADALDVATAQQYLVRLEADLRAIKP
jgi:ATP-dependent Lhr-like helicase